MKNLTSEDIQSRLSELPCPACRKTGYFVRDSGEKSFAERFLNARCLHCAYHFTVSIPTRPLREVDPDTDLWLKNAACPACEARGAELNFRGNLSVRQRFYFLTCKTCGHAFHDRAPMEAFE